MHNFNRHFQHFGFFLSFSLVLGLGGFFSLTLAAASTNKEARSYQSSEELKKRFFILGQTTPNEHDLKFIQEIRKNENFEEAQKYLQAAQRVQKEGLSDGSVWLCFEHAETTVALHRCGEMNLALSRAKAYGMNQRLKKTFGTSTAFQEGEKDHRTTLTKKLLAKFYVYNAAVAYGKITEDLCQADTMGWGIGTGRGHAILGCYSRFLGDILNFQILDSFIQPQQAEAVALHQQNIRDMASVENKKQWSAAEAGLSQADQNLNTVYQATKIRYDKDYAGQQDSDGKPLNEVAKGALAKFENAWIHYRDAYCLAYSVLLFPEISEHREYGPMARLQCLERLTNEQVNHLKSLDSASEDRSTCQSN